jgi:hypothetical protein
LEKGVIGEVKLADVLVAPSPDAGKELFRLADWSPELRRWAADREMKVSTHLAGKRHPIVSRLATKSVDGTKQLTDNGLLVLATTVQLEQLARTQCQNHTLIIFLQVVIYLRSN